MLKSEGREDRTLALDGLKSCNP